MCNINIFLKTDAYCQDKDDVLNLTGFLQSVTANSYSTNNHGDGVFVSHGKIAKSVGKVNLLTLNKEIGKSKYIIAHQRLSTSGREDDLHPFIFGDFVMVHNGVISAYAKGEHSDSYNLFKEFNEMFIKEMENPAMTRKGAVTAVIQRQFAEIYSSASYSIAIYDNVDKAMYYFKNVGKYINVYSSPNALFMTTNMGNAEYLTMVKEDFTPVDLVSLKVYRFTVGGKITYEITGDITPKVFVYTKEQMSKWDRGVFETNDDDDESSFRLRGSHSSLQKRLEDASNPLVDNELDYKPEKKNSPRFADYGPTDDNAYYEEELKEYKEKYFKKMPFNTWRPHL